MAWVLDGAHVVLFDFLGWGLRKTDGARKNTGTWTPSDSSKVCYIPIYDQ